MVAPAPPDLPPPGTNGVLGDVGAVGAEGAVGRPAAPVDVPLDDVVVVVSVDCGVTKSGLMVFKMRYAERRRINPMTASVITVIGFFSHVEGKIFERKFSGTTYKRPAYRNMMKIASPTMVRL